MKNEHDSQTTSDPAVASSDLLADFKRERNAALLEMDEQKLRAFYRKWNEKELPDNPIVFWGAMHKAVTGCLALPIEHRRKSKAWLDEHGMQSLDDGDLSANADLSGASDASAQRTG